jgi:hypothetical protein
MEPSILFYRADHLHVYADFGKLNLNKKQLVSLLLIFLKILLDSSKHTKKAAAYRHMKQAFGDGLGTRFVSYGRIFSLLRPITISLK